MTQRTTDGRGTERRLYRKDATTDFAGADAATRAETTPASSWGLDRRTFMKATTLLGVGGGVLGSLSAPVGAQTTGPWSEQQKLLASDGAANDQFGYSVSIAADGDTALVGTIFGDFTGAAYVYTRSGKVWSQQQKLTASDRDSSDQFGSAVSIDGGGDTALVGVPDDDEGGGNAGAAYVYTRSGGVWTEQQKLTASDAAGFDDFGDAVSIAGDGNTAIIGARNDDDNGTDSGSVYVFTRSGGVWTEQQKLTANDGAADDRFGWKAVAIDGDGDTAIVGVRLDNDNGFASGSAYVFTRSGGVWSQQAKLIADDAAAGDLFGDSVSISGDGDTALVGANSDDDSGSASGSAYVFTRSGGVWGQQAKLTADDGAANDRFGAVSIAGDGDTALAGARFEDNENGFNAGSAYVFTRFGGVWSQQQKLTASDGDGDDRFGFVVSLDGDGDTAAIGAAFDDTVDGSNAGSAYVFAQPPANQPPTAAFDYSPTEPEVGEEVTFDASGSSDSDGTIPSYEWDFGDGTTGSGQVTTHTYTAEDEYEVTLTVTDDAGATDTATQTVEVLVFAEPLVVNGEEYTPQDFDGNGEYDDIDGDDAVTNGKDTSALANIIEAYENGDLTLTQAQVDALDFNDDGRLTGADNGAYNRNRMK